MLKVHTFKTSYRLLSELLWSSPRPISNSQLHTLPCFHLCPIYLILFQGSYCLIDRDISSWGGFTLRCLQRLSLPDLATQLWIWYPADAPVVRPARSSRTKVPAPSDILRPRRIGTELSHDVLNPARVPL